MTDQKFYMRVVVTMLAGVAWPFFCGILFLRIGDTVLFTQIDLLQSLGVHSTAILKLIIHFSDPIFWAVVFGALFGMPLGILINENVMRYWWLFFSTVVIVASVGELNDGVAAFISGLVLSPFLAYQAGILATWLLMGRVLSNRRDEPQEAAAS